MCLRYAFTTTDFKALAQRFRLRSIPELKPRYNIAPTQSVPVIFDDSQDELSEARWGLSASWQHQPLFNARAESIDRKPSFRKDFEERRCLMLADTFYEWKQPEKRPFRVFLKSNLPFAFAGIYAQEEEGRACCMVTTSSNGLIAKIHSRMPVILPAGMEKEYLGAGVEEAKRMLRPYPAESMVMYEISSKVNSARNDSPEVLEPKTSKGTLLEYMDQS
jgi:putative SOS response-associated peptidase YedK